MSRRGLALFAAMSVIWGMPYLLIKIAVGGVPVPVLVLARVAVGAALLLPLALFRRTEGRSQLVALKPVLGWVALFACVEIIIPWFVLSEAERHIASSLTGLLIASVPIIIALLSLLIGSGERLHWVRWAGLLVGLAGVALLAGPDLFGSAAGGGVAAAVGEVLFVALCYAIGPLIANNKLSGVPPVAMTAASLSLATIVYLPLGILDWPSAVPSAKVLLSLAGLAVICTALAFLLFFALIADVGPARASVITYINPAIAVSLGVAVLGEKVTPLMLIAFATILAGSVLATRHARATRPAPAATAEAPVPDAVSG
ncbi:MAG TPA: EamA family transporter [Streptosporangiaceae bacterium]|nr:EamA family transporter [Streptosporangiaceae bacterium]